MMASRCVSLAMAVLMTAVLGGCGGEVAKGPRPIPASGKVTYKNQPVEGATVSFLGDGKIPPAMALTDSSGEFVLTTSRSGDGAIPGVHRVTVTKIVGPPAAKSTGSMSMEDAAKAASAPPAAKPLSMLPDRYAAADSSGLQFTVKAGDKNNFIIDLTD